MTTPRKTESNRANSQHSTGPRTEAGKTASSQNATRHSLTASGLIIPPNQESNFKELEAGLRTSLIPSGALQELLFSRILESSWNLHRCRLAESQLALESGIDPLLDEAHAIPYARIQRYARQYENSMYKAMRELSTLQTEAQYRQTAIPADSQPEVSELCKYEKVIASFTRHFAAELRNSELETKSTDRQYLSRLTAVDPSIKIPSVVD